MENAATSPSTENSATNPQVAARPSDEQAGYAVQLSLQHSRRYPERESYYLGVVCEDGIWSALHPAPVLEWQFMRALLARARAGRVLTGQLTYRGQLLPVKRYLGRWRSTLAGAIGPTDFETETGHRLLGQVGVACLEALEAASGLRCQTNLQAHFEPLYRAYRTPQGELSFDLCDEDAAQAFHELGSWHTAGPHTLRPLTEIRLEALK